MGKPTTHSKGMGFGKGLDFQPLVLYPYPWYPYPRTLVGL
jgi:hypothetical protein